MNKTKWVAILALFGFLLTTTIAQTFITNGLVAYYPFNGNANDASGRANNGTVYNAALAADRFGNANASYVFNGVNTYISVTNNTAISSFSNAMTISCWFTVSNNVAHDWVGVVCKMPASTLAANDGFGIRTTFLGYTNGQGYIFSDFGGGSDTQYFQTWVTNGTVWYQCVAVALSNTTSLYLNGQLVVQGTNSGNLNATYPLTIGGQNGTFNGRVHRGEIDDVRIYNRALSVNEVAQLFALESAPIVNIRKAVYLDSSNLWTGSNYVVQASTDLINWTNQGSVFVATNSSWHSTNYWDVANWNELFFRLKLQ